MIIYIMLLILPLIFHFYFWKKNEDDKKRFKCFTFLEVVFTLISAIRYGVGTDYIPTYCRVFYLLKDKIAYNYEFLFLVLNKAIIKLHGTPVILLSLCALFTIPLFFRFIRNNLPKKYWFLGIYLFIGTTIYYATMNVVRQYIAIAILLYAFDYLKQKKILKYVILNIIASLFHLSSLINLAFVIIYLLHKNKKINYVLIAVYLLSIVFVFVDIRSIVNIFSFMIPNKYINYLNSKFFLAKNYSACLKLLLPNLIVMFMLFNKNKIKNDDKLGLIYCGMTLFTMISNIGYGVNVFIRLGWYFDYFYLLVIPMIIEYFYTQKKTKAATLFTIFIICYCIFWNVYSIFILNGHGVIPYKTLFFK